MATIDEVYDMTKANSKKLDLLLQWKAALDVILAERGKDITDLSSVIFGNPTPESGLVSKVQRLTNCKKQLKNQSKTSWEFWRGVLQKLIVWGIIGLIVFLLLLYKKYG